MPHALEPLIWINSNGKTASMERTIMGHFNAECACAFMQPLFGGWAWGRSTDNGRYLPGFFLLFLWCDNLCNLCDRHGSQLGLYIYSKGIFPKNGVGLATAVIVIIPVFIVIAFIVISGYYMKISKCKLSHSLLSTFGLCKSTIYLYFHHKVNEDSIHCFTAQNNVWS